MFTYRPGCGVFNAIVTIASDIHTNAYIPTFSRQEQGTIGQHGDFV